MADAPVTENGPANFVDSVLQRVLSMAEPMLKAAEVAAVPWLGWWPISQMVDLVQDWVLNQLRKILATQATFLIVDFQTAQEKQDFMGAVVALKAAILKGDMNDPALLKQSEALDEMCDRLVHYDGSHTAAS